MKTLICGAGNISLSDEGFGVHFVRHLQDTYFIPKDVELCESGITGMAGIQLLQAADRVYFIDTVEAQGESGSIYRLEKQEILLDQIPLKFSPHQIGLQEPLALSALCGKAPECLTFFGVVAESRGVGGELSSRLRRRLEELAWFLVDELALEGVLLQEKGELLAA